MSHPGTIQGLQRWNPSEMGFRFAGSTQNISRPLSQTLPFSLSGTWGGWISIALGSIGPIHIHRLTRKVPKDFSPGLLAHLLRWYSTPADPRPAAQRRRIVLEKKDRRSENLPIPYFSIFSNLQHQRSGGLQSEAPGPDLRLPRSLQSVARKVFIVSLVNVAWFLI